MGQRIISILIFTVTLIFQSYAQSADRLEVLRERIESYTDSVPGLNETANISIANASLRELFRALAESHNLNLSLDKVPDVPIYNNFQAVKVKDLLAFLCNEYSLDIAFVNNILLVNNHSVPRILSLDYDEDEDLISFKFRHDTLYDIAALITEMTPYNLSVSPNVHNIQVSGFVDELKFESSMKQLGLANNLEIKEIEEGIYFIDEIPFLDEAPQNQNPNTPTGRRSVNRSTQSSRQRIRQTGSGNFQHSIRNVNGQPLISIDANGSSSVEAISQITQDMNIGYVLLDEPDGELDCHLKDVTFDNFLNVALSTCSQPMTFTRDGELYLIGSQENPNLSRSKVYQFQNRSVESLIESIPTPLTAGLELNEFPDLNAFIMTGSQLKIDQLIDFLAQIDKPVPNILIEVMVVEINEGYTVATGVNAALGDSVPPTSGNVFPNVDMTLNSGSINDFLERIDRRGLINLGKVTPQFYATIKALENNNNLNLRSTPKLSTINGNEANLTIGRSVYYLIETQNVTGGVNPIITRTPRYEKVEANLDIKIKPFVSYNEDITLSIDAEFSDFIDPTVQGAPPGNATRKFLSKIRIRNDEMIVLGGLEEASKSESASGTPVLSRIPVLKWIFSSKSKSSRNNKLLIFIKPAIVY